MPRAYIALAASKQAHGDHPNVVIIGAGRSVVLDVTNPEASFEGLGARWVEVQRAGRKPVLVKAGGQLAKVAIEAKVGLRGSKVDVGPRFAQLIYIAQHADSVVVGHTTPTGEPMTSAWTLTSLTVRVRDRRHGDNAITAFRASIGLTESNALASEVASNRPMAGPTKAIARRHVVRVGDSIWAIANEHYAGESGAWKRIASTNGLRDVRNLPVGKVLVLP